MAFAYSVTQLEYLESKEIVCVNHQKSLTALNDREYTLLTEQNHCLCNNVIYHLSGATNQSANDQRQQTLYLDTSK